MATPEIIRDQPFERALPNSSEAERAILGAVLLDNGLISQAIEQLRPEDFYVPSHRRIFVAIRRKDADEARRRMAEHLEDARELFKRATALQAQSSLQSRIGELKSATASAEKLTREFQRKRKMS